jgi:hypothetical protein
MTFRSSVDRCQHFGGISCFHVYNSWSKIFESYIWMNEWIYRVQLCALGHCNAIPVFKRTKYAVQLMFWGVHLRHTGHCQTGQCAKWWIDGRLVVASKIIIEDDSLERDVRSTKSGLDQISCRELLRRPSFGTFVLLVRHRVCFSTAVVPQLQLWHLYWLMSTQRVGDLFL